MMELIIYHCGEAYRTDSSNIGKKIRCRQCGEVIVIETLGSISPQPYQGIEHTETATPSSPRQTQPSSSAFSWRVVASTMLLGLLVLFLAVELFTPRHRSVITSDNVPPWPTPSAQSSSVSQPQPEFRIPSARPTQRSLQPPIKKLAIGQPLPTR